MKRILTAGAFALALGGPVLAADLPPPMAPPPRAPATYVPAVAPYYNWGGIYFGVNGGWAFGTVSPSVAGATNFTTNGGVVGGTLGANFQAGAFVFGVEGDLDWSGVQATIPAADGGGTFKSTWLGTGRGRVGYAFDRVLLYATGGGAFAGISAPGTGTTGVGWTGGAGIEMALAQNWTAKAEYLFVDIPSASIAGGATVKLQESVARVGLNYKFSF